MCVCGDLGRPIYAPCPGGPGLNPPLTTVLITKSYPNIYNPKFWSSPVIYKAAFAIIGRKMMSMMMMIRDEPITKIANKLLKSTICWPINTNNRRINWHNVQYVG